MQAILLALTVLASDDQKVKNKFVIDMLKPAHLQGLQCGNIEYDLNIDEEVVARIIEPVVFLTLHVLPKVLYKRASD